MDTTKPAPIYSLDTLSYALPKAITAFTYKAMLAEQTMVQYPHPEAATRLVKRSSSASNQGAPAWSSAAASMSRIRRWRASQLVLNPPPSFLNLISHGRLSPIGRAPRRARAPPRPAPPPPPLGRAPHAVSQQLMIEDPGRVTYIQP